MEREKEQREHPLCLEPCRLYRIPDPMKYRLTNKEGETVLHADSLHRIYRFLDHAPSEPYTLTDNGKEIATLHP
jgi:hypothetical protein